MFGFLTAASAILAAGLVTVAAICVSWMLRWIVADTYTQKRRRRKFSETDSERDAGRTVGRTKGVRKDSPFHVLGFTVVPGSFAEIRSAFLRESTRTHPDANLDDPSAAQRFDAVKQAYEQIGTPDLFHNYLLRHPPDEVMLTFDGGEAEVLTVDEFAKRFTSLKSKWERAEADRTAELDRRLLGGRRSPDRKRRISRILSHVYSRPNPVCVDDVIFDQTREFPTAKFFRLFDCFVRVDKKGDFYRAIRLLLSHNGFKDTFSDVKGNANCVTIIGDLPGVFFFPRPIKVLIGHDDPPEKLFTRLWDLGLYQGPKVRRVG